MCEGRPCTHAVRARVPHTHEESTVDLTKLTKAQLIALIAVNAAAPSAEAEAAAHYKAKDLPCTAAKPCAKTFRSDAGRVWHLANIAH